MWLEPEPRFVPHPWFRGPHRQTIGGAYLWRRHVYRAHPHQVPLSDGDQLVLHDDRPNAWQPTDRAVVLVHGLAGCFASGYMQRIAAKLAAVGFRALRLDLRGCGAGMTLARHSVHAGRTGDLLTAVEYAEWLCPASPLTIVGFSLGASIVLKLLGERASQLPRALDSAIAVAPPLDLAACSQRIGQGLNRLYDRNFVRTLCRHVNDRRQRVAELSDIDNADGLSHVRSLYEFDARFTAPLGGFANVEDYYQRASSLLDLPHISIPTRMLVSADDPLIPGDIFRQAELSTSTQLLVTPGGGHLGFLASRKGPAPDPDWHWMDWRIVDWVRRIRHASGWTDS